MAVLVSPDHFTILTAFSHYILIVILLKSGTKQNLRVVDRCAVRAIKSTHAAESARGSAAMVAEVLCNLIPAPP
jgi:hypothetical protein